VKSRISYQLPAKSEVSFRIYNNAGQLVKTLVDKVEEPGYKNTIWNGKNDRGRMVGSGIYFYRFEANSVKGTKQFVDVKKMLFLSQKSF
jgi:flagellar hook assembly protein FlgD